MQTMSATFLLTTLCLLASGCQGQAVEGEPVRVGVWSEEIFPLRYTEGGQERGFEADIRNSICNRTGWVCEVVELDNLPDRTAALENGTVDWVIAAFSVTPDRAAVVDFVHPYYYSTGAALFAAPANLVTVANKGWAGLRGNTVCLQEGYYAIPQLEQTYGARVMTFSSYEQGTELLKNSTCYAIIDDYTNRRLGVPIAAQVAPAFSSPYALAVAKGDDVMYDRLAAALVRMMQDGAGSDILRFEEANLVANGAAPSADLRHVVNAISDFKP